MSVVTALRRRELPPRLAQLVGRLGASVALVGCDVGKGCQAPLALRVEGRHGVHLGRGVQFFGGLVPSSLWVGPGAVLRIGDECQFNYGVELCASASVTIGRRCLFGSFARLFDAHGRFRAPVWLGDDVWVAHGAVIWPGVTVGDGAVIAAGSVVTHDVPSGALALGNPARVMSLALAAS